MVAAGCDPRRVISRGAGAEGVLRDAGGAGPAGPGLARGVLGDVLRIACGEVLGRVLGDVLGVVHVPQDFPQGLRGRGLRSRAGGQLPVQGRGVQARADQHQLGFGPRRGRVEAEEAADGVQAETFRAEGHEALDPVEPVGPRVEEAHQPPRVHRVSAAERDALVRGVGVLPAGVLLGREQVGERQLAGAGVGRPAAVAVEQQPRVDASVGRGHHGRAAGQAAQLLLQGQALRFADPVGLVEDDEIGDGRVAGVARLGGVDDLDQAAVDDVPVAAGEDHADQRGRLGQAAGLDDDEVDARGRPGEGVERRVQVLGVDGAAQAAVAEGGHGVDLSGDGHRVDGDAAEVVDDHADPHALAVAQEVVQERGLPRAEEPGEHEDRNPTG